MSGLRAGLRRWWAGAGERQERGGYSAGKCDPDKIPPPPLGPAPGAARPGPAGRASVWQAGGTVTFVVGPDAPGHGPLSFHLENVSGTVITNALSEIYDPDGHL